MPRAALSFLTAALVLAVVFAVSAVALVLISRPQFPPRLGDLSVIEGTLRDRRSGLAGTTLRLGTARSERTVDARGCAGFVGTLQAGDAMTLWVDQRGRVWRAMQGPKAVCTYLQAVGAEGASRRRTRIVALVLAVAGVVCGFVAIRGRFRRG
jgi:hypothetical protein